MEFVTKKKERQGKITANVNGGRSAPRARQMASGGRLGLPLARRAGWSGDGLLPEPRAFASLVSLSLSCPRHVSSPPSLTTSQS